MEPRIGHALSAGFRAANRSWAGIGFFGGTMLLVTVVSLFAIASTRPPTPSGLGEGTVTAPPMLPPAIEEAVPGTPEAAAPAKVPASDSPQQDGDVNLFDQLDATQPPAAPADTTLPPTAASTPSPAASDQAPVSAAPPDVVWTQPDEQERAVREWFGRAWPLVLFIMLVMLVVNVWLSGGQIAYLEAQVSHPPAKLSLFWRQGARAFGRLLGAWALMMGAGIAALLILALASALLGPLPEGVGRVLGWLVLLALAAAGGWLLVRLSFWFIAVVVARLGPVAGLKASWRATKGRWLKTAGLGLLIGLISIGVTLVFGLIEGVGNLIGGAGAVVLVVAGNLAGLVASLYIGFVALAAFIRFYQDVKGQAASSV